MKRLKKAMFIHSVKKINLRPEIYIEKTSISGAMMRRVENAGEKVVVLCVFCPKIP